MGTRLIGRYLQPVVHRAKRSGHKILNKSFNISPDRLQERFELFSIKNLKRLMAFVTLLASQQIWLAFAGLMATNPIGAIIIASLLGMIALIAVGYLIYSMTNKPIRSIAQTNTLTLQFKKSLSPENKERFDKIVCNSNAQKKSHNDYEKLITRISDTVKESLGIDLDKIKDTSKKGPDAINKAMEESLSNINSALAPIQARRHSIALPDLSTLSPEDLNKRSSQLDKLFGRALSLDEQTTYRAIQQKLNSNMSFHQVKEDATFFKEINNNQGLKLSKEDVKKYTKDLLNQSMGRVNTEGYKTYSPDVLLQLAKIHLNTYLVYRSIVKNEFATIFKDAIKNETPSITIKTLSDAFELEKILNSPQGSNRLQGLSTLFFQHRGMSDENFKTLYMLLNNSFDHLLSTNDIITKAPIKNRLSQDNITRVINSSHFDKISLEVCINIVEHYSVLLHSSNKSTLCSLQAAQPTPSENLQPPTPSHSASPINNIDLDNTDALRLTDPH